MNMYATDWRESSARTGYIDVHPRSSRTRYDSSVVATANDYSLTWTKPLLGRNRKAGLYSINLSHGHSAFQHSPAAVLLDPSKMVERVFALP